VATSSVTAHADAAGDAALAKVDAALRAAKTTYVEYDVAISDGTKERKAGLNVWVKGDKRLLEFTAPADLKGTKVLVLSAAEVYVYLPAFGKVRRIASQTTDQGLLGMTYTASDWAAAPFGGTYEATIPKPGVLALTAKTGKTGAPLEMTIDAAKSLPTTIAWKGADGKLVRTETLGGYTCEGTVCTAGKRAMTAVKATTTLVRKKWKVNEAIADDVFSKRNLEK